MNIESFSGQYRLRTRNTGAERVVSGKFGEIADMGDEGLLRLRLLAVPRSANRDIKLRNRRRAAEAGGLELKWCGDAESIFYFNPADDAQAKLAIRLAGTRIRRRLTPEQRESLSFRLAAARSAKAA
jgi:hypothetical protein